MNTRHFIKTLGAATAATCLPILNLESKTIPPLKDVIRPPSLVTVQYSEMKTIIIGPMENPDYAVSLKRVGETRFKDLILNSKIAMLEGHTYNIKKFIFRTKFPETPFLGSNPITEIDFYII